MSKRIEDGLFLGIDLGTSSVKLLVTDAKDNVIAESSASYPIYGEENGFFEQKPEDWINAIIKAAAELKVRERIYAIGLSAQMPTLVIMDADGKCLGNSIVWCDNRAAEEGRELLNLWGAKRHYETTGVFLDGRYLLPMYLWKRKEKRSFLLANIIFCQQRIISTIGFAVKLPQTLLQRRDMEFMTSRRSAGARNLSMKQAFSQSSSRI